jgi:hypothetical protein
MYGELRRRQNFIVKYSINYPSGKKWITEYKTDSYSEKGAVDIVKWLRSTRDITIISVEPTYEYIGEPIYPNNEILGDW